MREHLYRGKTTDGNKWMYGFFRTTTLYKEAIIDSAHSSLSEKVIPETVGQYTGLLDHNKVKIFEGDILRTRFETVVRVFWDERTACFGFVHIGCEITQADRVGKDWTFSALQEAAEVIGNIHDNPELLAE